MTGSFDEVKKYAEADLLGFWAAAAEDVSWITPATTILDDENPPFYRWFVGGEINGCYSAVDRHVDAGHGDRTAIIYMTARSAAYRNISAILTFRIE